MRIKNNSYPRCRLVRTMELTYLRDILSILRQVEVMGNTIRRQRRLIRKVTNKRALNQLTIALGRRIITQPALADINLFS